VQRARMRSVAVPRFGESHRMRRLRRLRCSSRGGVRRVRRVWRAIANQTLTHVRMATARTLTLTLTLIFACVLARGGPRATCATRGRAQAR
jgi:hypothetical protein